MTTEGVKECWICLDEQGTLVPSRCDCTDRWHHDTPECFGAWSKRSSVCPACDAPYPVSEVTLTKGEVACRLATITGICVVGGLVSMAIGLLVNLTLAMELTPDQAYLIEDSDVANAVFSLVLGHMLSIPLVWLFFWLCLYRTKLVRRSYHETDYWWYIFFWILLGPYFVPVLDILLAPGPRLG